MTGADKDESREVIKVRSMWLWLMAGALAVSLASFRSDVDKNVSLPAPSSSDPEPKRSLYIFDVSPSGLELLVSKTSTSDLWFRDATGRERWLASNVVRASFSPDGKKFAYGTSDNEIFIETIDGEQLARLTRASDHAWCSNSTAVTFSAIAGLDYPELEQTVIYHLPLQSDASSVERKVKE